MGYPKRSLPLASTSHSLRCDIGKILWRVGDTFLALHLFDTHPLCGVPEERCWGAWCYVFPYLSSPDSLSPMVFQGA